MATAQLSALRTRLELLLSVASSDSFVNSETELNDLNLAYEKTAYYANFPQMLIRVGLPLVTGVDRYPLPTGFRKAHVVKVEDAVYEETELETLKRSRRKYAIDRNASQIILSQVPTTGATSYTITNSPSAAAAATLSIASTSGISQYDELWIDSVSGTDEFTLASSVSATSVTARLRAAKSANDVLYRQKAIIDIWYYRNIVALSAATDTMLIPDELDYSVCLYAAANAYLRLEEYGKAKELIAMWEQQIKAAAAAQLKNSTGLAGQFVIA